MPHSEPVFSKMAEPMTSVAESRTVSRETRLRFARQVSRDSRIESRNKKISPKMAKNWLNLANIDHFFTISIWEILISTHLLFLDCNALQYSNF